MTGRDVRAGGEAGGEAVEVGGSTAIWACWCSLAASQCCFTCFPTQDCPFFSLWSSEPEPEAAGLSSLDFSFQEGGWSSLHLTAEILFADIEGQLDSFMHENSLMTDSETVSQSSLSSAYCCRRKVATKSHLEGITMIKIKAWMKSEIENPQSDRQENIAESLEISCIGSPPESLKEKADQISWRTTVADALLNFSLRLSHTSFEVVWEAGIPATTDSVHFILMYLIAALSSEIQSLQALTDLAVAGAEDSRAVLRHTKTK